MRRKRPALLVVLVLLAACGGTNRRIKKHRDEFNTYPADAQRKIRAGQVDVGFSKPMVELAYGKPERVYQRKTSSGSEEVWAYTEGSGSPGLALGASMGSYSGVSAGLSVRTEKHYDEQTRVIFQDGIVTSVETKKQP